MRAMTSRTSKLFFKLVPTTPYSSSGSNLGSLTTFTGEKFFGGDLKCKLETIFLAIWRASLSLSA